MISLSACNFRGKQGRPEKKGKKLKLRYLSPGRGPINPSALSRSVILFFALSFFSHGWANTSHRWGPGSGGLPSERHLLDGGVVPAQDVFRGLTQHWCEGHQLASGRGEGRGGHEVGNYILWCRWPPRAGGRNKWNARLCHSGFIFPLAFRPEATLIDLEETVYTILLIVRTIRK